MRTRQKRGRKRKSRKRNTRKQMGGFGATISIVSTGSDSKQYITSGHGEFEVYPSKQIKEDRVMLLNDQTFMLTQVDLAGRTNYTPETFFEIYDNIGGFYLCSRRVEEEWKRIAEECQLNIAVFNGEGATVTKYMRGMHFIQGLNILAGCSTSKFAEVCNRDYNKEGKYFIGFDNFKHNYGTSFFTCPAPFNLTYDEFMEKYEALGDELPIVKTIKIAHDSFRIRNCGMLTLDGVVAKINAVLPKIRKGAPFENKDHYFESKYRIHCQTMPCVPDEVFETYIRDLCTRFIDSAAAKDLSEKARKAAERETEQARRAESGELNKEDVRRRSKNGDDITEDYKLVLNENFQDMFRDTVDGYIEGSEPDTLYKIIYKQNGTMDYLELIEHSKTGVVRDRSYYSFAENEPVNSKGGELEYEYE